VVIPDARKDPTYRDNPAIRELGIVAYCGVPLTMLGFSLGAFCVIDEEPRTWSYDEVQTLKELGDCAIHEIETRSRLNETETALRDANDRVRRLEATIGAAVRPTR
jgi:GAF domain-containing protein